MRRVGLVVGLVLISGLAGAQAPAPPRDPFTPTDLTQWKAYGTYLKAERDGLEYSVALCRATEEGLRAEVKKLQAKVAELEAGAKKGTTPSP